MFRSTLPIVLIGFTLVTTDVSGQPIMPKDKEAKFRAIMPKVEASWLQVIINHPATIYYTNSEIPPAFQNYENGSTGVWSIFYNHAPNTSNEPYGNANREFPWAKPFGTHLSPNSFSFRFLHLPKNEGGITQPIVWWEKSNGSGHAWAFPDGAIVGEVLYMKCSKGYAYVYEIRTRTRLKTRWKMNVFRPYPTAEKLSDTLFQYYLEQRPIFEDHLRPLYEHLIKPLETKKQTLNDDNPKLVFKSFKKQSFLPLIPEKLAIELLNKVPFSSAAGREWQKDCHAPTQNVSKFHIVPKEYLAGFMSVDSDGCMKCHETCNQRAKSFDNDREWWGRVRGSDGIFSFHPFDPSCISKDSNLEVVMNKKFIKLGIIDEFDPKVHTQYRIVTGLD